MGCVISHQAKSRRISQNKVNGGSTETVKKKKNVVEIEIENGVRDKYGGYADDTVQVQPSQSRRRSKANPRLSNPPKHLHGEQVAAGWPPWLTAVCGEALSGWIPRKADTFEKIDKVPFYFVPIFEFMLFNLHFIQ
jgi:cyclin-dependent kinase 12/13